MTQHPTPHRHRPWRLVPAILGLLALAGCSLTDPYQRPGVWRPTSANETNFELQVARAADLVRGRGAIDADGDAAAAAVERLRQDKVRVLPASSISKIGGNSGAQGGGGS